MGITAIFGGTFNPFHIGHYEMLSALQNDDRVEEILVLPDKIPPHKSADFLASDEIRIECCRLAIKDFGKARLCLIEFEREGKSYTYDTVLELKKTYGDRKLAFVMGGDMFVYFDKWYKSDELINMLSFIVFRRTDTKDSEFDECLKNFSKKGMDIILFNDIITDVSSTTVRNDFKNAEKLLPSAVYEYLKGKGVYNGKL